MHTIYNNLCSGVRYELVRTWVSIDKATVKNNVISFKDNSGDIINNLFIRDSYLKIFGIINKDKKNYYIGGNPGIGKTMFIYYILFQLWSLGIDIVFETVHSRGSCFLFYRDSEKKPIVAKASCTVDNIIDSVGHNGKNLWYISDTVPPIKLDQLKTILISSRAEPSKEFLKFFPQPQTIYMPLWKIKELYEINDAIFKIDKHLLNRNYHIWGGVPFKIFGGANIHNFFNAISKSTYSIDIDAVGGSDSNQNVSHELIHISVDENDPTFGKKEMIYASKLALELILYKNITKFTVPLEAFFSGQNLQVKKMGGQMYESYVLRVLGRGGSFTLRLISDPSVTLKITITNTPISFSDNNQITISDKLYIPKSGIYPAVDAILTPGVLFQITISANHKSLPVDSIKSLIKHLSNNHSLHGCGGLKVLLVTITPSETCKTPLKINGIHQKQFELDENLEQWYLQIPFPHAEELKNFEPSVPKALKEYLNISE